MSAVISDEILQAANMTPEEMIREIAILLYQQDRISLGKASEIAGMSRFDFQQLLASRDIPLNFDVEDLRQDLETLRQLGRR